MKHSTKTYLCKNCGTESKWSHQKMNVYCSNACSGKGVFTETINRYNRGELKDRNTIRKVLTEVTGYKCSCCGISEHNSLPLTLQVDHIDGNAGNNSPDNLRLICPNCHSQSDTFSGKNKGNGRAARGLSLR
jgi:Zn finger protein HypA/HybF involved in hydrogenase expression